MALLTRAGGGISQMLTIADKGGWGSEKYQQRVFMGTKNVDGEDNWFKLNHTC